MRALRPYKSDHLRGTGVGTPALSTDRFSISKIPPERTCAFSATIIQLIDTPPRSLTHTGGFAKYSFRLLLHGEGKIRDIDPQFALGVFTASLVCRGSGHRDHHGSDDLRWCRVRGSSSSRFGDSRLLRGIGRHHSHQHRPYDRFRGPGGQPRKRGDRVSAGSSDQRHAARCRCCCAPGSIRPDDGLQRCGRPAGHRRGAPRPRWPDSGRRHLQHGWADGIDRHRHLGCAGRSQRGVHLPGGIHVDHRVEQHGRPDQRGFAVQRVLAGG